MCKKICPKCKEEINLTPEQVESLKVPQDMLKGLRAFRGKGCNDCNGTGKKGRTGIYEVMPITPDIENAILNQAPDSEFRKIAAKDGMFSLRMAAIDKMKAGLISLEEVFAVTTA